MGIMLRLRWTVWAGVVLALGVGGVTGPLLENPVLVRPKPSATSPKTPSTCRSDRPPMEKSLSAVLTVLYDTGFEIYESNRYDGRIETFPRIAPGWGLFMKPGSTDAYERLLATLQTYRHRTSVLIQPAENGGFFIHVTVRKELEDLP